MSNGAKRSKTEPNGARRAVTSVSFIKRSNGAARQKEVNFIPKNKRQDVVTNVIKHKKPWAFSHHTHAKFYD